MKQQQQQQQQQEVDSILMDDDKIQVIGPPASRAVIDNLKKLLTQRQHSRESDAENFFSNKEAVPSTGSDLESELSFYSLLTSSTSDSDLDFLRTSPDNRKGRRRQKRNLSTSSSSSSSLSPVRERRKRPKRGVKRYDLIHLEDWNSKKLIPSGARHSHSPISQLADNASSANIVNINIMVNPNVGLVEDGPASSSNKESTTDDDDDRQSGDNNTSGRNNGNNHTTTTTTTNNNTTTRTTRLRKTRRDRNKRRKHPSDKIRCGHHHHRHHSHNHHHHHSQEDNPPHEKDEQQEQEQPPLPSQQQQQQQHSNDRNSLSNPLSEENKSNEISPASNNDKLNIPNNPSSPSSVLLVKESVTENTPEEAPLIVEKTATEKSKSID